MKYKVGDIVEIRAMDVDKLYSSADRTVKDVRFNLSMDDLVGRCFTVETVQISKGMDYQLSGDARGFNWTEEMLNLVRSVPPELELLKSRIVELEKELKESREPEKGYIGKLVWCWDDNESPDETLDILLNTDGGTYKYETKQSCWHHIRPATKEEVLGLIYEEK